MRIKKLQWDNDWEDCWVSEGQILEYYINASDPSRIYWTVDNSAAHFVSSVKEAKRAVQTHWENYVRSEFMEG